MPLYRDGRIQAATTVADWLELQGIPRYFAHRLDRATSGILLVCHSSAAAAQLQNQFHAGTVRKQYIAVCRGRLPHHAIVRTSLARLDNRNASRKLRDQPRQTAWTVAQRLAYTRLGAVDGKGRAREYSLALVRTKTGRRHQIRRHLKFISHPLVGDTTWGKGDHNRYFRTRFASNRLLLHALALGFDDPATAQRQQLHCPLGSDFQDTVRQLGWDTPYERCWNFVSS